MKFNSQNQPSIGGIKKASATTSWRSRSAATSIVKLFAVTGA